MQALIAALAAVFGIVLGYWLRQLSAKSERDQTDRRAAELASDLANTRNQLNEAQSLAASRAGFESLSAEREKTIDAVTSERDRARDSERTLAAQISQLEAELKSERAESG